MGHISITLIKQVKNRKTCHVCMNFREVSRSHQIINQVQSIWNHIFALPRSPDMSSSYFLSITKIWFRLFDFLIKNQVGRFNFIHWFPISNRIESSIIKQLSLPKFSTVCLCFHFTFHINCGLDGSLSAADQVLLTPYISYSSNSTNNRPQPESITLFPFHFLLVL